MKSIHHFWLNVKGMFAPKSPRLTLEEALWTSLFHGYNSVPWEAVR